MENRFGICYLWLFRVQRCGGSGFSTAADQKNDLSNQKRNYHRSI